MHTVSWCRLSFAFALLLLRSNGAGAQSSSDLESVFFAQPNNTISRVVSFETGDTEAVIVQKGSNFQGLAVRTDGRIVVANRTGSGNLLICNLSSKTCDKIIDFKLAEALDTAGALVAVNTKDRILKLPQTGCSPSPQQPDCLPGGYERASEIRIVGAKKLADVKFARGGGGEVFVLMQDPRKLIKITDLDACGSSCSSGEYQVVLDTQAFLGKEPVAFAFQGDGDILVAMKDGSIQEHFMSGPGSAPFGSPLGGSPNKIVVGTQEGNGDLVEKVFVSVQNGAIRCFLESGAPCGEAKKKVNAPDGVGIATGAFLATLEGDQVQTLAPNLVTTWTIKPGGRGNTVALCRQDADPREKADDGSDFRAVPLYLCRPGRPSCDAPNSPTTEFLDLGLPNVIPHYVRGFRPGPSPVSNFSGPPTLPICIIKTSADFTGIILDHVGTVGGPQDGISWTGYDLHDLCPGGSLAYLGTFPEVLYSPAAGEDPIVEGNFLTAVTIGCNHPLGGSYGRSVVAPGVWFDVEELNACEELVSGPSGTGDGKLPNLEAAFEGFVSTGQIQGACGSGDFPSQGAPEAAFGAAGIGPSTNWTLVRHKGTFFMPEGGTITVKAKVAGFDHAFGRADVDRGNLTPIITTSTGTVGSMVTFDREDFDGDGHPDPYVFYFENNGRPGEIVFSDSGTNDGLDLVIYRNNTDSNLFAIFFDDGGGDPDDDDFDDLVLTATLAEGPVGTRCALEKLVDDAQVPSTCPVVDVADAAVALKDLIGVVKAKPEDFTADQIDAQLVARALSAIYVIEKKDPQPQQ